MELYFRELGQGTPLVFLHGIYGSTDNWLTHTRMLSDQYHTLALDLRNHGRSPHDAEFDYPAMVADVLAFITSHQLRDPVLIGHSMGGKVAMNFAVAHPDKLQKLVVIDIAPKAYNMRHDSILEGLNALPVDSVASRSEADEALARFVEEPEVRQFLLKNLQRKPEGGFTWKLNLGAITNNIEKIGEGLQFEGKFDKPTLFVRGAKSKYIRDSDIEGIQALFPKAIIETLNTGHWVPAEQPKEFVETLRNWLQQNA